MTLLAHGLLVFAWSARDERAPEPEDKSPDLAIDIIEFEQIDPDKVQGEPEPDPEAAPVTEPEPEPEPKPKPKPKPKPRHARAEESQLAPELRAPPSSELPGPPDAEAPLPESISDERPESAGHKSENRRVDPPNATWVVVIANSRIQTQTFRDAIEGLLPPPADLGLLVNDVKNTSFKFWNDFDYVVMGSPDLTNPAVTFIAAQYKFGRADMQDRINRACLEQNMTVDWHENDDVILGYPRFRDPNNHDRSKRRFVLPPDGKVALYLREEYVPHVISGPGASTDTTSGNFVANAASIRPYTDAEPNAEVQFVFGGIRSFAGAGQHPPAELPSRVQLMLEDAVSPNLVIKLAFLKPEHAVDVHASWNHALETDLLPPKVRDLVEPHIANAIVERSSSQLVLRRGLTSQEAQVVLRSFTREFAASIRWLDRKARSARVERRRLRVPREDEEIPPQEGSDQNGEGTEGDERM